VSISLQIEGLEEVQVYLDDLVVKLESSEFWDPELAGILEEARRFAASISPVVTGSYRAAHRVVVGNMRATLSIDPAARNSATGTPVSRYAANVEERHGVYARTFAYTERLAVRGAEAIGRNLVGD